jgi:hypothetical protein
MPRHGQKRYALYGLGTMPDAQRSLRQRQKQQLRVHFPARVSSIASTSLCTARGGDSDRLIVEEFDSRLAPHPRSLFSVAARRSRDCPTASRSMRVTRRGFPRCSGSHEQPPSALLAPDLLSRACSHSSFWQTSGKCVTTSRSSCCCSSTCLDLRA